jgi:hypothetical protein
MHVPYVSPVSAVINFSGVDSGLHEFVGISWHILMPYTFIGAALMIYSQSRLLRGQHDMAKQAKSARQEEPKKSRRWKQIIIWAPNGTTDPATASASVTS